MGKYEADFLLLALDPTRAEYCSRIKILNLQDNLLGKDGGKIISKLFEINNTIEVFNIYNNKIGVAGA